MEQRDSTRMTVEELLQYRNNLQMQIAGLLKKFSDDTGLIPNTSVYERTAQHLDGRKLLISVEVTIKLT